MKTEMKEEKIWTLQAEPHPATTDQNKSTKTGSAWEGKVADLSKEKGQKPVPQWAFTGFNLHRNTGRIVKLINHCQAEMIKQQITYKEL